MDGHSWEPIEDLPQDWEGLRSEELSALAPIWVEQLAKLQGMEALKRFHERLRREWAIETGILEGLYSIDRGTTRMLIERGIEASLISHGSTDKPAEEIVAILNDHGEVIEGVMDFVGGTRPLTPHYIREVHAVLTRHQAASTAVDQFGRTVAVELLHGEYKRRPNNPLRQNGAVHEYCPPEHVQAEMDRLVALHDEHASGGVPPEVESAWLHHRFAQIHPFQDGNGRVARVLASLVFMRARWLPLVVDRDHRGEYLDALESADRGDLAPLVALFASIQRTAFVRAISLSENVIGTEAPLAHLVAAIGTRLRGRKEARDAQWSEVYDIASDLHGVCEAALGAAGAALQHTFDDAQMPYKARADASSSDNAHYYRAQIIETARALEYFASVHEHPAWVRLRISEDRTASLVVSFHGLGRDFSGVMTANAFLEYRDYDEDGQAAIDGPHCACDSPFIFAFNEDREAVRTRFDTWLNRCIQIGLEHWRRQL